MRPGTLFSGLFQPIAKEQPDLFARERVAHQRSAVAAEKEVAKGHLFLGGPPRALLTLFGLESLARPAVALRMLLVVLLGWLPLFLLTAIESAFSGDGSFASFLGDCGVQARSLVAAPLLIAAEAYASPRLSAIAGHFAVSGLIGAKDAPALARAAVSTVRLRDARGAEVAISLVGVALALVFVFALPAHILPAWQLAREGRTPAALWHDFFSVPILLVLLFGWFWRLFLWTRFLVLVSRLDLKLVAAHPDRAGGLGFVGLTLEAVSLLAFALGAIVAGTVANRVLHDGASLLSFRYVLLVFVVTVALVFVCPLMVFTPRLIETWQRGVLQYGALSRSLGLQMERRWLDHAATAETLDANDFSATTDLYAVAANVYRLIPVPVALRDLAVLVLATLLPFLPVVLLFTSPAALFTKLTGISL